MTIHEGTVVEVCINGYTDSGCQYKLLMYENDVHCLLCNTMTAAYLAKIVYVPSLNKYQLRDADLNEEVILLSCALNNVHSRVFRIVTQNKQHRLTLEDLCTLLGH